MTTGEEIKHIRQAGMLSQEAFAKALGVSFTTVNRWECGKSKPSYKAIKQISEFCHENGITFDVSILYSDANIASNGSSKQTAAT